MSIYSMLVKCSIYVPQAEGDAKKSRVNRKHVIGAVTCAVVTAMVITGFLVGVKFILDNNKDIVVMVSDSV